MYPQRWTQVFWWPILAPHGGKKNTKKEKKMHIKLQCQLDWWLYELNEYARHVEHRHKEYMKYVSMNKGVLNLYENDQWYLQMQSMPKWKSNKNLVTLKTSTPL